MSAGQSSPPPLENETRENGPPASRSSSRETPSPAGILIVAGSAVLRTGLREIIEPAPDLQVVGDLSRCEPVATAPDLVLVAINATLPATPAEVVTQCRHHYPPVKIMLLTDLAADADLAACLQAGAAGLFPLELDTPALIQAIRTVLARGLMLHLRAVSVIRPHFTRRPGAAERTLRVGLFPGSCL